MENREKREQQNHEIALKIMEILKSEKVTYGQAESILHDVSLRIKFAVIQ